MMDTETKPRAPIRRFDVFAEYNRLKGLKQGLDEPHARGYGLWVAKVVASGRRGASQRDHPDGEGADTARQHETPQGNTWHELGGEPQTDALFDREVVRRMGSDFYERVFAPAIAEAAQRGERYESIRDSIRKGWTPAR
jgi:hypothetical protein